MRRVFLGRIRERIPGWGGRLASLLLLLCGLSSPAAAQLDESCTISVLNRTAQVQPSGSWRIDNVPANFGLVRARATCVRGGVTRSGQSEYFNIQANRTTGFGAEITLGEVDPIPESLAVSSPVPVLTGAQATAQLTVTARYAGGATTNVTAGSAGTAYTVSNPAIATVSPDGLLTGLSSGSVLVSATKDGALGLLQVSVQLTGDADGDGLPDDLEVANGLDPLNPLDALQDFDGDGLTNRLELIDFGTGIRNADSDGDGILDGEEVFAGADGFVTNPLLADTDGDGFRDALEVVTGSDPTDPASFDLSRALQSLEISPDSVVLTVNTVLGEASRQLMVTGRLIDGTSLDLTASGRGTNYSSSDLGICNFGATAGRIFAGSDGDCTITATNAGFSAQATITVRSFAPTALSCLAMPGFANNVDVNGNQAYVAAGTAGLVVAGVDDRRSPRVLATFNTAGNADDVRVESGLAYVADGPNGLLIVDVGDPSSPALVGSIDTPGNAQDVVVRAGLAYVADGASGLQIVDVGNPAAPRIVGTVALPAGQIAKGVDVVPERGLAAVVSSTSLQIVDVSDATRPILLGLATTGQPRDVALQGDVAYVADYEWGFVTVDVSDPSAPLFLNAIQPVFGGLLFDVAVANGFAFGADVYFVNGVPILGLQDPESPVPQAILDFSQFGDFDGTGIAVDSAFVYLTASLGIIENGTTGTTRLCIGQYVEQEDNEGVPPTVRLLSPQPGDTWIEGTTVILSAEATDDVAVASVDFLIDGETVSTDAFPPYEFGYMVLAGGLARTVEARATDLGGNIATATAVGVAVVPDPLTNVTGRVITEAGDPVAGADVTAVVSSGSATDTTGVDGTFFLDGLPTVQGNITVDAVATVAGEALAGSSTPQPPVPGGLTDVGDIRVRATGCASCQNVSLDRFYTLSPAPESQYPDSGGELTNGGTDTGESWINAAGWLSVNPTITLDLGQVYGLNEVEMFVGNSFGNGSFGVFRPASVTVSVSSNGTTFTNVGALSFSAHSAIGTKEQVDLGSLEVSTAARFVRYSVQAGGPWVMLMELQVWGTGCTPCSEASCSPVQAAYISHFTSLDCTGEEHYYTPYFGFDGIRRTWDGQGCVGTALRTVTNRSYKDETGTCRNAWPSGNTLTDFVRVYR
jgi:hypothetical protein